MYVFIPTVIKSCTYLAPFVPYKRHLKQYTFKMKIG